MIKLKDYLSKSTIKQYSKETQEYVRKMKTPELFERDNFSKQQKILKELKVLLKEIQDKKEILKKVKKGLDFTDGETFYKDFSFELDNKVYKLNEKELKFDYIKDVEPRENFEMQPNELEYYEYDNYFNKKINELLKPYENDVQKSKLNFRKLENRVDYFDKDSNKDVLKCFNDLYGFKLKNF